MLCKQGLGNFRSEVSKIYAECVTACLLDVLKSLYHMDLALHDTDGALVDVRSAVLVCVSLDQGLSSVDRQAFGKAVTADSDNTDFYLG